MDILCGLGSNIYIYNDILNIHIYIYTYHYIYLSIYLVGDNLQHSHPRVAAVQTSRGLANILHAEDDKLWIEHVKGDRVGKQLQQNQYVWVNYEGLITTSP